MVKQYHHRLIIISNCFLIGFVFLFILFFSSGGGLWAEQLHEDEVVGDLVKSSISSDAIKEKQMVDMNNHLKNVMEENQRLLKNNERLTGELARLREESQSEGSRYNELRREKERLAKKIEEVSQLNRSYANKIKELEKNLVQDQGSIQDEKIEMARLSVSSETLVMNEEPMIQLAQVESQEGESLIEEQEVTDHEMKTLDVLTKIDAFAEEDERLRLDAAKAHFNMGNIYFQKGEYEIAFREYYQAVTLMPDDPDSHYNLAFVSAEYLKDYNTALQHYRMYLYLRPNAKDANLVRGKIQQAKIALENIVDSPLEEPEKIEK